MPDLAFRVEGAEVVPHAAAPAISLRLRVENRPPDEAVESIALRCQIRIDPRRRAYSERERSSLSPLFGEPSRGDDAVRPLLWAHANINVPTFTGSTVVEVPVACSYDFHIASTRYFQALDQGHVPLLLLFSGTIFFRNGAGALQIAQVPWSREARFDLPIGVYAEMTDRHYPNSAGLLLRRDVFERLLRYRDENALVTFEDALERLLERGGDARGSR